MNSLQEFVVKKKIKKINFNPCNMKPNDNNVILPPQQRLFRVLIISGSEPTESNGIGTYSAMERLSLNHREGRPINTEPLATNQQSTFGKCAGWHSLF